MIYMFVTYSCGTRQNRDAFHEALKVPAEISRRESGNIMYDYFFSTEDDTVLYLHERWQDSKSLEAHFKAEHFKEFAVIKGKYGIESTLCRVNDTLEDLESRRSIRKFKDTQVPKDVLRKICEAGTYAASGKNKQPAAILAIQDPEVIAELEKIQKTVPGAVGEHPFYGAPTVIVVLADPEVSYTYIEDGTLVMGNLMNAAHALGVDSCWVHRAKEEFDTEYGKALLNKYGLSQSLVGIGHLILGYRDCDYPEARPRKENYIVEI